ncbi:MAG: hypothetical protein Q8K82_10430, partial [Gemmatimonadaceae bacterium]|nr:hypothetical protein [Gemmatimonadaceae bacterium]
VFARRQTVRAWRVGSVTCHQVTVETQPPLQTNYPRGRIPKTFPTTLDFTCPTVCGGSQLTSRTT